MYRYAVRPKNMICIEVGMGLKPSFLTVNSSYARGVPLISMIRLHGPIGSLYDVVSRTA
jgi:hypothetical protein